MGGELKQVPKSVVWKDIIIGQSQWFITNEIQAKKALIYAVENEYEIKNKAKSLMDINRGKFNYKKMAKLLNEVVDKYTKNLSTQVNLNLPKLKKVSETKSEPPKIKLPKLKKVTPEGASV